MMMKRFDAMVNGFAGAINRAKDELKKQGFDQVEIICEMIMEKGGIKKQCRQINVKRNTDNAEI
ncbi:MAG: hypothetical protein IJO65_00285 [Lachnospiraceae bacterium]|nr:hypothetical protein [Lachnospiraceae bacterium]